MGEEIKTFEIRNLGNMKEFYLNGKKLDMTGVEKVEIEVTPSYMRIMTLKNEYFTMRRNK